MAKVPNDWMWLSQLIRSEVYCVAGDGLQAIIRTASAIFNRVDRNTSTSSFISLSWRSKIAWKVFTVTESQLSEVLE